MNTKLYKLNMILFAFIVAFFLAVIAIPNANAADCTQNYGGGETCRYDEDLSISKKVRKYKQSLDSDEGFKDKVNGIKKGDTVEFKIKIKNEGDKVKDVTFRDYLPEELKLLSGDTKKEYDELEAGESKTIRIKVRVRDSEFDRTDSFEKCVVNKAEVRQDGDRKASDTATVCYGDVKIEELPETGSFATVLTAFGSSLMGLGLYLRKKN